MSALLGCRKWACCREVASSRFAKSEQGAHPERQEENPNRLPASAATALDRTQHDFGTISAPDNRPRQGRPSSWMPPTDSGILRLWWTPKNGPPP